MMKSFIAIVARVLFWGVACGLRRITPIATYQLAAEIEFWLRPGSTLLSIPLFLLMFMPLYFDLLFIVFDFEAIGHYKAFMSTLGWSDKGALWVDPVAETLYIIG